MEFTCSRNPSDTFRYDLLRKVLKRLKREEDFYNIIHLAKAPLEITKIAEENKYQNIRIAILGSGLSGLAAAYELHKLGCEIVLFEANSFHLGGRVYTHYFNEQNYGELGAMRVPISHETTWHYINLFKLNTLPFNYETENDILYVDRIRLKGKNIDKEIMHYIYPNYDLNEWERNTKPSKLIEYVLNDVLLKLDPSERKQLLIIQETYPEFINFYDSLNFYQACNRLGLSEGTINLISNIIGHDRGLFYNSYLESLKETYSTNYAYYYRIENGMNSLPLAFLKALIGKIKLKIGYRVIGIYDNPIDNEVLVKYRYNNIENTEKFDYVVCTLPFSQLRLIDICPPFSSRKMEAISLVNYAPSQKTLMLCNKPFWGKNLGGSSVTDLAITSIWYPVSPNQVLTASYNMGLDATRVGNQNEFDRIELIKRQLEAVHGLPNDYLDMVVEDYITRNWNCYEYSLGAFCWYQPGQNRLYSYSSIIPEFNNKVFFSGEHTSSYHAWMQGALQSGMVAANNIAYLLNLKGKSI